MLSIITHHLTEEGCARFAEWFARMQQSLQRQPGFVAVRAFRCPHDDHARVVVLEMSSAAATEAWVRGPSKAEHLATIASWSTRPFEAQRLLPLPA